MWDLIVSVPDHCLSFYFTLSNVIKRLHCATTVMIPTLIATWEHAIYLLLSILFAYLFTCYDPHTINRTLSNCFEGCILPLLDHQGSTVGFRLLQCSSGVVRHPRDLQMSVATHC